MELRPCIINDKIYRRYPDNSGEYVPCHNRALFHRWGQNLIYVDTTNTVIVTQAIVEYENGKVGFVDAEKVQFIDTEKNARSRRQSEPGTATQNT